MKRLLISAFSCQPGKGSEPGVGWNWVLQAAQCCDVYVLTRSKMQPYIEPQIPENIKDRLHFEYCPSSSRLRKISIYLEYLNWQRRAFHYAKKLCITINFDYVWHLTWGNFFLPTWMYRLDVPFIWGPAGGGEQVPQEYLGEFSEKEKAVSKLKRFLGNHIMENPWIARPASKAEILISRTNATKDMFPIQMQEKIIVHLEACVNLQKDFEYRSDTPLILKKGKGLNLIYTGRLNDSKNVSALIDAMVIVCKTYPDCKLHILGDGSTAEMIRQRVAANRMNDNVYIYGSVPRMQLLRAVSECDIFVFPSLHEGASWSLLEAMALSVPIVAYDLNGIHDTLDDSCAYLVKTDHDKPLYANLKFADALLKMMSIPSDQRQKMGQAGRQRLITVHSADGVAGFIRKMIYGS